MIIHIALGVALGGLILIYHKEIIALGLFFLVVAIALCVVVGGGYYLYSFLPSQSAYDRNAQASSTAISNFTSASVPTARVRIPKKYRVAVRSDADSEQRYEIMAAEDATPQELQAEVSATVKGKDAWIEVAVMSDGAVVYADLSSVVNEGSVVRISWLIDYQGSVSPPKDHSSAKMLIAHDCSNRQTQILSTYQYHNYMARSGGGSRVVPQISGSLPVPTDGGQFETMWKFACR